MHLRMSERVSEKASWELSEGEEIAQGRSVLELLGGGNRYEAYLVWDEHLLSPMVAKVIRPDQVENEAALRGLRREAEALDSLAHPVILRGFDAVFDPPHPHVLVEQVDGPTLRRLVRGRGPLALEQVLPLARHLAAALHYMAAEGWVHLDVKPDNIVMGVPPRVIDLSLARTFERAARVRDHIGTNAFMAPEQCVPDGDIGPAADVWGLGATLYYAVTGAAAVPEARVHGARRGAGTALPSTGGERQALAAARARRARQTDPRLPAPLARGAADGDGARRRPAAR